jgi:hypothetical protein
MIIAGRTFARTGPTSMAHDAYLMKRWRRFGLSTLAPIVSSGKRAPEEVIGAEIDRLIVDAFESGLLYEVLAGMLVEQGVEWSPEWAAEATTFFSKITAKTDKTIIYESLSDIITDFFAHAVDWIVTSRSSSSPTAITPSAETSGSEATLGTTTGNGIPSSGNLPNGTLAATAR